MNKVVASDINKDDYRDIVNDYIEQLRKEKDITLFNGVFGYYMYKGLVHEIKIEENCIVDETYESWSIKEKNFLLNVINNT